MPKKRSRRPQPLAPPPQSSALRSRKRARQVTTLFHKYTQERDAAVARAKAGGCRIEEDEALVDRDDDDDAEGEAGAGGTGTKRSYDESDGMSSRQIALLDDVRKWDDKLSEIGGREEYQRRAR